MKKPFLEELRTYKTPLGILPSVTTILKVLNKPALVQWAANMALSNVRPVLEALKAGAMNPDSLDIDQIIKSAKSEHKTVMDEAADLGTQMHRHIADSMMLFGWEKWKEQGIIPSSLFHAWDAYCWWRSDYKVKAIAVEQEVYHSSRFAGTLDFYGTVGDKLFIIDFKSSSGIWPEYSMQIAAYWKAWVEMTSSRVDGWGILRLDKKTGEPEWKEYSLDEMEVAFQKFNHVLQYFLLENGERLNGKKKT